MKTINNAINSVIFSIVFKLIHTSFQLENNQGINEIDPTIIMKKLAFISKIKCLSACKKIKFCEYAGYNSSICILYSLYARFYIQQSGSIKLYRIKNPIKLDLENYWPIVAGEGKELISSKNLFNGASLIYVPDRFGNKDSAFKIISGYYQAPPGIYFGHSFTILAWAKLNNYLAHQRLFDFGNGAGSDNILVSFSNKINFHNYFINNIFALTSNKVLELNIWYHLAFSAESGKMSIFINGLLDSTITNGAINIRNITRNKNYFGKSLWSENPNALMEYDDIKFFNRILTQSEIKDEYDLGKV